jgi:hypothetical protein
MPKRILPENEIGEKYKNGSTSWQLGKEYSCDHYTIIRLLRRNGIEIRVWGSNSKRAPSENTMPDTDKIHTIAKAQGLDDEICEVCGVRRPSHARRYHIHHADRNHRNNKAENLLVLCPACHKRLHLANQEPDYSIIEILFY